MHIDYEYVKKLVAKGQLPKFVGDLTVEEIEALEAELGQPEAIPRWPYTEAGLAEFKRRLLARIRQDEQLAAELGLSETQMEEWRKSEEEMEEWWKGMRAGVREEKQNPDS